MTDQAALPQTPPHGLTIRGRLRTRLAGSRRFQKIAARIPGLSRIARAEGEGLFDIIAGFAQSQVLFAIVELRILHLVSERTMSADAIAAQVRLPVRQATILLNAAVALDLLDLHKGAYRIGPRGAAVLSVPGVEGMICHHHVLYRDLADPVAFLRGDTETELAHFWPYVFGAAGAADPDVAKTYSDLMADSQALVAEDTLATVDLSGVRDLLDIGGGTGAFLTAVGETHSGPLLHLFDLPAVAPGAESRFRAAGLWDRAKIHPGSFRDDPLPEGADTVSLIRVLYDHSDETVQGLLSKVYDALPPEGRLVVSEPMTGGDVPTRAGDVYFALYTLAMRTGRARSQNEIAALVQGAGFENVATPTPRRAFVTSVVTGQKPPV